MAEVLDRVVAPGGAAFVPERAALLVAERMVVQVAHQVVVQLGTRDRRMARRAHDLCEHGPPV